MQTSKIFGTRSDGKSAIIKGFMNKAFLKLITPMTAKLLKSTCLKAADDRLLSVVLLDSIESLVQEAIKYDYEGDNGVVLNSAIIYGHIYTAVSEFNGFFETILENTELVNEWLEKSSKMFDILENLNVSPDLSASLFKFGHLELNSPIEIVSYTDQHNRKIAFETDLSTLTLVTNNGNVILSSIDVKKLFGEKGVMQELSIVENVFIPILAWKAGIHHNPKVLLNAKQTNIKQVVENSKDYNKASIFGHPTINIR